MAKIGLPKGSGKRLKVREKSVKSQEILKWILSGNPAKMTASLVTCFTSDFIWPFYGLIWESFHSKMAFIFMYFSTYFPNFDKIIFQM